MPKVIQLSPEAAALARDKSAFKASSQRPQVFPFDTRSVRVPSSVPVDPLENLLVLNKLREAFSRPVTFRAWLDARQDENSAVGDLSRDAAMLPEWDGTYEDLREQLCPDGVPSEPCPTISRGEITQLLDDVFAEYKEQAARIEGEKETK